MSEFLNDIQPEEYIGQVLFDKMPAIDDSKVRVGLASFISKNIWENLVAFGEEKRWLSRHQRSARDLFGLTLSEKVLRVTLCRYG